MAEVGSRDPASDASANRNIAQITSERRNAGEPVTWMNAWDTTRALRKELRDSGLKGFKRGGRVHRTGIYKLHRGERVIPARSRRARRR